MGPTEDSETTPHQSGGGRSLDRLAVGAEAEVSIDSMVTGGRGKAILPDGRVAFVAGAAPDDIALVRLTRSAKRFAEADVAAVLDEGPGRQVAPCAAVAAGCGGCDWQHLTQSAQTSAKHSIVRDAFERLGRIPDPPVQPTVELPTSQYRTTLRGVIDADGRAGFRARATHDAVVPEHCLVAHPLANAVFTGARFRGIAAGKEVTVRVSAATGQRLVVVDGPADGVDLSGVDLDGPDLSEYNSSGGPEDKNMVRVISARQLSKGRRAWIFEDVAGRLWRLSAESFFQPGPAGAEALVGLVQRAAETPEGRQWGRVLDAYCGVGLFGGSVLSDSLIGVERSPSALADARVNLAHRPDVTLVPRDMAGWEPVKVDLAIVDPPRSGMSSDALARLVAAEPDRIVMVSCDPATAARDAGALVESYDLASVVPVDQFGHTSHVEMVATFNRR